MTSIAKQILTVTALTRAIKNQLESHFPSPSIKGEVTNLRKQSSGHYYFNLKDEQAQIAVVLFKRNADHVTHLPKMGDQVVIHGELNIYPPRGVYQIIAHEITHAGVGDLLLRFHHLKEKLYKMGWYDQTHKKQIPFYPKTIGVVTSPTGAVIQDILHVLNRRHPYFHLILNPVKVQGEGAAVEIARAIDDFNHLNLVDVIIIGRGGGSLEDLWAFNEECVACSIFHSKIPIISAIGHETDVTIADFVADVRAPTPSAAAELSVKELHLQLDFLQNVHKQCYSYMHQIINQKKLSLSSIQKHSLLTTSSTFLSNYYQKIDGIYEDLNQQCDIIIKEFSLKLYALKKQLQGLNPRFKLKILKEKKQSYEIALKQQVLYQIARKKQQLKPKECHEYLKKQLYEKIKNYRDRLNQIRAHLQSIHPKNLLKKGYCILFAEKDDSVIMSTHAVKVGDKTSLLLHNGSIKSTISEVCSTHE